MKAKVQVNGIEYIGFFEVEFELPEGYDGNASDYVENNFNIRDHIDYEGFYTLGAERPKRKYYDSEEEYQEAVADFKAEEDEFFENFYIESVTILDDTVLGQLKERYVGCTSSYFEEEPGWHHIEHNTGDEYSRSYFIDILIGDDGKVLDLKDPKGHMLAGFSTSEYYEDIYPDFDDFVEILMNYVDEDYDDEEYDDEDDEYDEDDDEE